MPHLSQAAVSRVGHQDMAHHPCSRVPPVGRLVDPEEVDVPVEVGLQVRGRHPREAPQVAFEPGAQVVHHLHPLQVDRVVHIGPVRLALEPAVPDQRVVRPLEVVDQQRPGRYPAAHGLPHARRAGLPVAADDRDRVLVDVDGDADAQLLAGEAALAGLPVALGEVGVVYVGLVHPDGVAQHDPVLVAGHRREHAVPPLEGRLVGDAAHLGRALDGHVVAHEPDEGDPGGERLSAVLEDGAREGVKPPAAAAAAPPRDAGGGGAVPPGAAGAAPRALRVRPIGRGGLGQRADADLVAAAPLVDGFSEQQELVGGEARHERPEGVRSSHMDLSHPPERPPGGIVAKQRSGWALGQILCLAGKSIAFGGLAVPESSPVI